MRAGHGAFRGRGWRRRRGPCTGGLGSAPAAGVPRVHLLLRGITEARQSGFFDASNPASIQSQLAGAARRSPIHALIWPLTHVAVPLGVLIALAEFAVGLGALLGLWTRMAAAGGMAISFGLFLTVSFHSNPFYTGSDIVFVFAWTPLLLGGSGGVLSVDALLAQLRPNPGWGRARSVRGRAVRGRPRHLWGLREWEIARLAARRPVRRVPVRSWHPTVNRRGDDPRRSSTAARWRSKAQWTGLVAALAGRAVAAAGLGRLASSPVVRRRVPSARHAPKVVVRARAPRLLRARSRHHSREFLADIDDGTSHPTLRHSDRARPAVPVGGAASFQDPASGDPALVIQPTGGNFLAFDAVCPHAGCMVQYDPGNSVFVCPCHSSVFNEKTGAVENGPAASGLGHITITKGSDGQLYVT